MMTQYKKLQIIKHALAHYIQREGADPADLEAEKALLGEVEADVAWLKEKYRIPDKEKADA